MHGSPCEMMKEAAEEGMEKSSPEEVVRNLLESPPTNPEEFMAKLKESGYELKPISHHEEEGAGFLPPKPKMVILRLDAARNALKESSDE